MIKVYKTGGIVYTAVNGKRARPVVATIGEDSFIYPSAYATSAALGVDRTAVSGYLNKGKTRLAGATIRYATMAEALSLEGAEAGQPSTHTKAAAKKPSVKAPTKAPARAPFGKDGGLGYSREGRRVRVYRNGAGSYAIVLGEHIFASAADAEEANPGIRRASICAAARKGPNGSNVEGHHVRYATVDEVRSLFPSIEHRVHLDRKTMKRLKAKPAKPAKPAKLPHPVAHADVPPPFSRCRLSDVIAPITMPPAAPSWPGQGSVPGPVDSDAMVKAVAGILRDQTLPDVAARSAALAIINVMG